MNDEELEAGLATTPGYRYAERAGNELFVAGQVPHDSTAALQGPGDAGRQATACLDNLKLVLEVHGFGVADLRHVTIYVVGEHENLLDAWGAVTAWFPDSVPPATLLGVHLLGHTDQLVEVDARIVRRPS